MSIRRNLAWATVAQCGFFALQFLSSVVLTRLLSPYEMGIYAIAVAVIAVLTTIQAFGLSGLIVREHDLHPDLVVTAFTVNAAIALLLGAAIAGLSTFGGAFLHEAGVKQVMLVAALMPIIGIFEFLPSTNLERNAQFKTMAIISTLRTLVATILTIVLALYRFSFMSMAYGQLGASLFSVAAYNIIGYRHVSLKIGFAEWRRITKFGVQMLAISGANAVAARMAELFLGRLIGLGALGLYSRASGLNNLLWENIHLVVGRVVFVDLAAQKRQGIPLRDSYIRVVDILTGLLWPAFTGLAILSGPLILNVYGARWVAAAHPLVMLCISSMILVSITMTWELFVVSGETNRQARIEFIRAGGGLVLFVLGCLINLTAAAGARIGEAVFSLFLYKPHLDRMTRTTASDFTGVYLRSAALTVVANSPAMALMLLYHGSEHTPILYVVLAVALGMLGWLVAVNLTRHPLAYEVRRLLARKELAVQGAS